MHDRVAIVGVGCTGFRSITPEQSYKEMVYEAAMRAYNDAGVDPRRDVESFVTVAEDFHEGTSIFDEYTPDQIGGALKPVHTITGDGLHGIATAYMLIRTGQFDIVAVEGHSKASNIKTLPEVTAYAQDPILNRPLKFNSHFIAGLEMNRYLFETDSTLEQCAAVVVKNRFNALNNPLAPYGANLSLEDVLSGPVLSWPLGSRETAEHADGAIVMVLASEEKASSLTISQSGFLEQAGVMIPHPLRTATGHMQFTLRKLPEWPTGRQALIIHWKPSTSLKWMTPMPTKSCKP